MCYFACTIDILVHRVICYLDEGSVLFNDALNTFSYGYMASGIW